MIHFIYTRATPQEIQDWYPFSQKLEYDAMLNIRPRLGNRSMYLQNPELRDKIAQIADNLLRNVMP